MKTIYLVSCVKGKKEGYHQAKELYDSDRFRTARALVETTGESWYILSAKYGLVAPEQEIAKYDKTLNNKKDMPIDERRRWSDQVFKSLQLILEPGDKVIILAGQLYHEFLVDRLQKMGVTVEIPMKGMRQGEQLQWMKKKLSL
ncbi:MAG: DUF6884 domain-containing protein [bacterium]